MNHTFRILFLVMTVLGAHSSSAWADKCQVVRAAFDIGSGATRIKVAKVDRCTQKVIESLYDEEKPVPYKEDLSKNENVLSPQIIAHGMEVLRGFKEKALSFKPAEFKAVATSAFRGAKNGLDVIKRYQTELGIETAVISQKEEGELGFLAVRAVVPEVELRRLVVWDIGGGSMQIVTHPDKKINVFEGDLASVNFKDRVIKEILNRDPLKQPSPNPLGLEACKKAVQLAEQAASSSVKQKWGAGVKKILADRNSRVFGIGGVHYYSVKKQTQADEYTLTDIQEALNLGCIKNDEAIGGSYASTEVTNLALVLGYMTRLKISRVKALKINLTDGLLLRDR